jgi:secreted protein with Ig-like and vWFA domain
VLDGLHAGSGTHGSAGIQNAYAMATNHFIAGGVNRVILCTDGDFNVGITDQEELLNLITARAKSGVFLSVLGFGMDNLKDSTLELLADRGNGNYAYIDSFAEARKVLVKQLDGTLVTVAKDAKIQVEFNPMRVSRYRLLGYEKRLLRDRDFNDDTKDAGEVGAGHSVTVLYEIEPAGGTGAGVDPLRYRTEPAAGVESRTRGGHADELMNLKIRYKQPDGQTSRLMEMPVKDVDRDLTRASVDFKFAASVAGYGMLLRQSPHAGTLNWEKVLRLAEQGQGNDVDGYRAEFIDLARRAQTLRGQP